jgi:hypothetical protein
MIRESVSGKNEDLILEYPKNPKIKKAINIMFTATGYLIK